MWYEIIPSFAIITAAMAAPHAIAYVASYLVHGNGYHRSLLTQPFRLQYLRDRRVAGDGNAYKVVGLEAIPDE